MHNRPGRYQATATATTQSRERPTEPGPGAPDTRGSPRRTATPLASTRWSSIIYSKGGLPAQVPALAPAPAPQAPAGLQEGPPHPHFSLMAPAALPSQPNCRPTARAAPRAAPAAYPHRRGRSSANQESDSARSGAEGRGLAGRPRPRLPVAPWRREAEATPSRSPRSPPRTALSSRAPAGTKRAEAHRGGHPRRGPAWGMHKRRGRGGETPPPREERLRGLGEALPAGRTRLDVFNR